MHEKNEGTLKPDVCRTYIIRCGTPGGELNDPEYIKLQKSLAEGFVVADIVAGNASGGTGTFAYLLRKPDTSWVDKYKG